MSWLTKIQEKPRAEKIKLIWIISGTVAVVLLILSIWIGRVRLEKQEKLKAFEDINEIIKDTKETDLTPSK